MRQISSLNVWIRFLIVGALVGNLGLLGFSMEAHALIASPQKAAKKRTQTSKVILAVALLQFLESQERAATLTNHQNALYQQHQDQNEASGLALYYSPSSPAYTIAFEDNYYINVYYQNRPKNKLGITFKGKGGSKATFVLSTKTGLSLMTTLFGPAKPQVIVKAAMTHASHPAISRSQTSAKKPPEDETIASQAVSTGTGPIAIATVPTNPGAVPMPLVPIVQTIDPTFDNIDAFEATMRGLSWPNLPTGFVNIDNPERAEFFNKLHEIMSALESSVSTHYTVYIEDTKAPFESLKNLLQNDLAPSLKKTSVSFQEIGVEKELEYRDRLLIQAEDVFYETPIAPPAAMRTHERDRATRLLSLIREIETARDDLDEQIADTSDKSKESIEKLLLRKGVTTESWETDQACVVFIKLPPKNVKK